jgi:putative SOS response-associated peptidase YedK
MCGRITLRTKMNLLLSQFAAEMAEAPDWPARFNVAPTQDVLVLRHPREVVKEHWGLIPSWAKDKKISYSTINARADSVATKPAFRSAFKKRRCLVLADGYFEWKKEGKAKLPYLYEVDGGKPFAFAGLWEWWREPGTEGEGIESCTIITTEANALASEIHDRMPVILDAADYDRWLDPGLENPGDLLKQFPSERMCVRPVNTFVNNARNQGEQCVGPPN